MWRRRKFIVVALLATVVLAGSIGGVALAQTEEGDDSQPKTLFERVTDILVGEGVNITSEQLKDAFTQAQSDLRSDALRSRLQALVGEGKITQPEADEYLEWWQAKPDVPAGFSFKGRGGFRGMHGVPDWGHSHLPPQN